MNELQLSDSERSYLRQVALSQACHDDKGQLPQEETLARAKSYYDFLVSAE